MSNAEHSTTQLETTGTTTLPPPPPYVDRDSLNRRLDIISVAIICGVIVVCFIICFIVGCRRTKRRRPPRCQDVSTPTVEPTPSDTEGAAGIYREPGAAANRSATSRGDDSPPPTYSHIERQTSFTSSVCSQTSSMIDIPPTYDDAFEPPESDLDNSGQWFRGRDPRLTDRHGSLPSNPAVTGVSHSADRSSSLQHSRPPRLRGHRHYSDVTDPHRRKRLRMRARPSPLTENDQESAGNVDDVVDSEVERSIDVIPEVASGLPITGSLDAADSHSPRPLLKDTASHHATTSV